MSKIPPQIGNYFYILAQSWTPALKYHSFWKKFHLNEFCYWTLHCLWLNSIGFKLTEFTYNIPPSSIGWEDKENSEWIQKLNIVCPSLIKGQTNLQLHTEKVEKHGACVIHYNICENNWKGITNRTQYLRKAAELATTYNMGQYLQEFSLRKEYKIKDLAYAIAHQIDVEPRINFLTSDGKNYLDQIYLYFDSEFIHANHDKRVIYLKCNSNERALALPKPNMKEASSSSSD